MKILVVTPFFYPHIGGSQKYMEEIYVNLRQIHPEIEVDVLCYNTDKAAGREVYRGLNVYRIPCWSILPGKFTLPNPISLFKFLNSHHYDLIHASTRFFDSSWWAPLYAKLNGTKVIITDHCADTPTHTNPLISLMVGIIDTVTGNLFLKLYDQVFVVSKATQAFLKHKFNIKSEVIYGGAEIKAFKKTGNKRIQVVFAGRMTEQKGVLELFEVAKELPEADFLFAGAGELEKKLKESSNIEVLGTLNQEKLTKLLQDSDIFVLPTSHSEGIPLMLLEAGAAKLAVITTPIGGIKEIIENDKTGILIEPKDQVALKEALLKLISDNALRNELGQALYEYLKKNFNWGKSAEELYSFYKNTG